MTGWPRRGDCGVVAVDPGGEPVGAAWLRLFDASDRGYGFVATDVPELSMAVRADRRGIGIGRALLEVLVPHAVRHGYSRISLGVEHGTRRAVALYLGAGFREFDTGPTATTMVKDLDAAVPQG